MTTTTERVMARIAIGPPEFSDDLLRAYAEAAGFEPPAELVAHWRRWGYADGKCGPDGSGNILTLFSLAGALEALTGYSEEVRAGMAPVGVDAGPCQLVYTPERGYGWLDYMNAGAHEFMPVAPTLEGVLAACEAGTAV